MLLVAGFNENSVFTVVAQELATRVNDTRKLCLILVLLCFFFSMLITNDVALIVFVPFAVTVLSAARRSGLMIFVIVMQTAAANLGSAFSPIGNPQNLFLYNYYGIGNLQFFEIMLPVMLISLALIVGFLFTVNTKPVQIRIEGSNIRNKKQVWLYSVLFIICLASVAHLLPHYIATAAVVTIVFLTSRDLFYKVDYKILFILALFSIFVGNLAHITVVREWMASLLQGNELLASVMLSQVISNVPATFILSGFTGNYQDLLLGTNIGGLGTLVASLASLISFKIYAQSRRARPLRYLMVFSGVNAVMLLAFWGTKTIWH